MQITTNITIVTATLNRRHMLARSLASAGRQGREGVQHLVIDGGSTDGTLQMLLDFPHLEVVSEPDLNLYDAWNKGISRANGEFIFLLNSDDEMMDGAVAEARRVAAAYPDAELISGPVMLTRGHDSADEWTVLIDDPLMVGLRQQDVGPGIPLTNGRFISRRLLDRIGVFDVRYQVASDRQFFLRALASNAVNVTTAVPFYRYHVHDTSLTLNDNEPSDVYAEECLRICVDGLREAKDDATRNMYQRWHAWCVFYLVLFRIRETALREAVITFANGCERDPLLTARAIPQLVRHFWERDRRRGRPLGSHP